MRTIIAGSRSITEYAILEKVMNTVPFLDDGSITPSLVLCGMARGVDLLGKRWAEENGLPVEKWPADWKKYGKAAGIKRNEAMVEHADALVALWDGKSRGTAHVMRYARARGLKVYVYKINDEEDGNAVA